METNYSIIVEGDDLSLNRSRHSTHCCELRIMSEWHERASEKEQRGKKKIWMSCIRRHRSNYNMRRELLTGFVICIMHHNFLAFLRHGSSCAALDGERRKREWEREREEKKAGGQAMQKIRLLLMKQIKRVSLSLSLRSALEQNQINQIFRGHSRHNLRKYAHLSVRTHVSLWQWNYATEWETERDFRSEKRKPDMSSPQPQQ